MTCISITKLGAKMTAELVGWTSTRGFVLTSLPKPEAHTRTKEKDGLDEMDFGMDVTLAT